LCGADRQAACRQITTITVYRATAIPAPDLGGAAGSVALIHSPRAGQRFAEVIRDKAGIAVAAISQAAAEAAGSGWERVEAADRPSDDALLALAAQLCNKPAPQ
jgi:uroporphyrinogen-III synthase